jgi:hypothetical protein
VLADAEKMAKRVDRVLEADPFAASLLAREYLSLVPEMDVNPLNQRGRTDAWTSAFVRIRFAANQLDKDVKRADGEAYLLARAEERRLFTLFGSAPRARLVALRGEVRSKRGQQVALRLLAWISIGGAFAAFVAAFALESAGWGAAGAGVGAIVAAGAFAGARTVARGLTSLTQRAADLERGISGVAAFETSDTGRGILQRMQREHPLLVRTSMAEESSAPPPVSENRRRV